MSRRKTTPPSPLSTALLDGETPEQAIARLTAELADAKAEKRATLKIKVSAKGAVQLDGLRRFPVTFYADEWERIFGLRGEIEAFIVEHRGDLKVKKAG